MLREANKEIFIAAILPLQPRHREAPATICDLSLKQVARDIFVALISQLNSESRWLLAMQVRYTDSGAAESRQVDQN